jgi:hypothetical protein
MTSAYRKRGLVVPGGLLESKWVPTSLDESCLQWISLSAADKYQTADPNFFRDMVDANFCG